MAPAEDTDVSAPTMGPSALQQEISKPDDTPDIATKTNNYPFKRWMDSFRSKKQTASQTPLRYVEGWSDEPQGYDSDSTLATFPNLSDQQDQQWEQLSGHSSVLETVKTASMSITTQSVATRSRATTQSSTNQSGYLGSPRPDSETRISIDSLRLTSTASIDDAVQTRAIKRRQVLHEILSTESDYVTGLKALTDVLSSFLTARPAIYHNIQEIRNIHEILLEQLRVITPKSEEAVDAEISNLPLRSLHDRWSSIDLPRLRRPHNRSLRTRNLKAAVDSRIKAVAADPFEAQIVARELDKLTIGFAAYEDFCSTYGLLTEDLAMLRRSHPAWAFFDRGIEALCKAVASKDSQRPEENRAMTLNDLLIKPIQRVCKYPLLLHDLLKNTPASDCPEAHEEISQILEHMRQKVALINTATGNPLIKDRIMKTVVLQEKLEFAETSILRDVYRQLGPMILCGVLHVAYESREKITGEYMVCVLFHGYMVLAKFSDDSRKLRVVCCLYILDMKVDALTNGRGLRCHGCGFSWKIIFEDAGNSFELILSASSGAEEKHWKTELLKASVVSPDTLPSESLEPRKFFMSSLDLAPLDHEDDLLALLTRRSSTKSLATPSMKLNQKHVIIKRTNYPSHEDDFAPIYEGELERSQTSPTMRSATLLNPKRIDRVRLERSIIDVYTRDVLPYPGMVLTRAEFLMRASPGSLMRRLSFHTPFGRRSSSMTTATIRSIDTVADIKDEDEWAEKDAEEVFTVIEALPVTEESTGNKVTRDASPETLGRTSTIRFKGLRKRAAATDVPSRSSSSKSTGEVKYSPKKLWNLSSTLLSAISPSRNRSWKD